MPDAERQVPLTRNPRLRQLLSRVEESVEGDQLILVAMSEQNRRRSAARIARLGFAQTLRPHQRARIAENRRRRASPTQAHMQRQHRALAEADQGEARIIEAEFRELRVEKS